VKLVAARDLRFGLGGLLVMLGSIPLGIAILGSMAGGAGLLFSFGTAGLLLGFAGFLLIGNALFKE
jgi:hypothetical protein